MIAPVRSLALPLLLAACTMTGLAQPVNLPTGWFKGGRPHEHYETGTDAQMRRDASPSVFVRAASPAPGGFGTIMQVRRAEEFRGKRVRLSGYLRSSNVLDWAGLWLRVDPADPQAQPLAFENMAHRPVKGSQDWARHEIVLDVPPTAAHIYFGVLLAGSGTIWGSELNLEIIGPGVPLSPRESCCIPSHARHSRHHEQ